MQYQCLLSLNSWGKIQICMQSYEISVHANGFWYKSQQIINVTQLWFLLLLFFPSCHPPGCKSSYCNDEEAFWDSFLSWEGKRSWGIKKF